MRQWCLQFRVPDKMCRVKILSSHFTAVLMCWQCRARKFQRNCYFWFCSGISPFQNVFVNSEVHTLRSDWELIFFILRMNQAMETLKRPTKREEVHRLCYSKWLTRIAHEHALAQVQVDFSTKFIWILREVRCNECVCKYGAVCEGFRKWIPTKFNLFRSASWEKEQEQRSHGVFSESDENLTTRVREREWLRLFKQSLSREQSLNTTLMRCCRSGILSWKIVESFGVS